jgi:hypothetical protein
MSEFPPAARAMADAVLRGDRVAAYVLMDLMQEAGPPAVPGELVYVWDNGESYSDHDVRFVSAPESLPVDDVISFLAAREAGAFVYCVIRAAAWLRDDVEPLHVWCGPDDHGWLLHEGATARQTELRERVWSGLTPVVAAYLAERWRSWPVPPPATTSPPTGEERMALHRCHAAAQALPFFEAEARRRGLLPAQPPVPSSETTPARR